jgi:thioredoxin reductase
VLKYPTVELRHDEVTGARREGDAFEVTLASGETATARRIVLAMGVRDALPALPGLRERWGASVLHCPYCHGYEVADRRLGVLAASEGSVHHALLLPDWSADVTLFLDGAFEPTDEQRAALRARGVRIEPRRVAALLGEAPSLEEVQLEDGETVGLDALFTAPRTTPAGTLAEQLGCELVTEPHGTMVRADSRQRTSAAGVFAAGDLTRFPHNATWASSDGVMAGIAAHQSLAM